MMKITDLTPTEVEIVHKLVWLMNEYPGKTINDFAGTFLQPDMGVFDINVAIWQAEAVGYIVLDDPNFDGEGHYKVDMVPDDYEFGEDVAGLMKSIPFLIARMNKEEGDIMEKQLQLWFAPNHPRFNYTIALKRLLNDRVIASYELTNVNKIPASKKAKGRGKTDKEIRDTYTFYTMWENGEQRWGAKQFPDQSRVE
jgi:hypothetical protein